ncbi:MAG TPA: MarR family winged helix-turn-helix transcriptional regulator [Chloroflexota bacterium]|nr:MarR family winged helix-turn-helix transcriptional regulator [Chloroflexota bacterium]
MPELADAARVDHVEALAASLPRRASLVARLLQRYASRYANFDVNPATSGVLLAVMDAPRRITELAEIEGQTQPYVTKLVSELESRGWVERVRDQHDGRVVWVRITEAGCTALTEVRRAIREMLSVRLSRLSDAELEKLVHANEALNLLIDTLQQEVDR